MFKPHAVKKEKAKLIMEWWKLMILMRWLVSCLLSSTLCVIFFSSTPVPCGSVTYYVNFPSYPFFLLSIIQLMAGCSHSSSLRVLHPSNQVWTVFLNCPETQEAAMEKSRKGVSSSAVSDCPEPKPPSTVCKRSIYDMGVDTYIPDLTWAEAAIKSVQMSQKLVCVCESSKKSIIEQEPIHVSLWGRVEVM